MNDATATTTPTPSATPAVTAIGSAAGFGRGLAAIRILFGMTFLLNGLAKLFEFHTVHLGPYHGNLINKADARFILDVEVNTNAAHQLPLVGRLTNDLLLPNWGFFGWAVTVVELAAGVMLVLGLFSRLGAALALSLATFLTLVYFSSDRWLPERPLEMVPLIVLALVPAGRIWGLDRRRAHRWPS